MDISSRLPALCLFSGGLAAVAEGLAPWFAVNAYCEIDRHRRGMLLSRQFRGEIDVAPIWSDVTSLRGSMLPFWPAAIFGTYPCKGFSPAGPKTGMGHRESGLFWHIPRLAEETKAPIIFLENTWPGVRRFVPSIRNAFERIGYDVRDGHLAAGNVGARHRRERHFLLAYSEGFARQLRRTAGRLKDSEHLEAMGTGKASDAQGVGRAAPRISCGNAAELSKRFGLLEGHDWDSYAGLLLGMDSGIPLRGKRIGALGDTNPPVLYQEAFMRLMGLNSTRHTHLSTKGGD